MKKIVFIIFLAIGTNAFGQAAPKTAKSPTEFVPAGYFVSQEIQGDLNKDNQADYVFIIKEEKRDNFVKNRFGEEVDRNRRDIIIAFKNQNHYELVLENRDCFSSENEDGGVYLAPELGVGISKGSLRVNYNHGRYGYWGYSFRYQKSDFELIGYDSSQHRGPVVERTVSINFLTNKMQIRENINQDAEAGDEKFTDSWKKFTLSKPIKLREITDFVDFDVNNFLGPVK
jgi:hypothetical protein